MLNLPLLMGAKIMGAIEAVVAVETLGTVEPVETVCAVKDDKSAIIDGRQLKEQWEQCE